jgi:LAGLIDADG-like domain
MYHYNTSRFQNIQDEQSAYFLGLIAADGGICSTKNLVSLSLHHKDRDLLYKLATYIETDKPIRQYKDQCLLNIHNKIIYQNIISAGLPVDKTYNLKFPSIDKEYQRHFIRGFFDGDGHVGIINGKQTKRVRFNLVGTCDILTSIIDIFETELGLKRPTISFIKSTRCLYQCHIYGKENIAKIKQYFYQDSTVYMKRKFELFQTDTSIKYSDSLTSRYPGVSFRASRNRWRITYYQDGKRLEKACYRTEEEAYNALLLLTSCGTKI